MIHNLNQVSFQRFGTVFPTRNKSNWHTTPQSFQRRSVLTGNTSNIYIGRDEICLYSHSGMVVLSVSEDGTEFNHFYLDKNVHIRPGVQFTLYSVQPDSEIEMISQSEPRILGSQVQNPDLLVIPQLKISSIYTFFYQEREQGFFFPGESHVMPELTYVDQGTLHSVVEGNDQVLEQGEMTVYGPGQWHLQYSDVGVAPRFVTLVFDLEQGDLSRLYNRKMTMPQHAVVLLQQMLRERDRPDHYSDDMVLALLDQLILTVLREADRPGTKKVQTINAIHSENEIVRRAQQYIQDHLRDKLSVPLVARMVDVSASYLTALFHKNLQISPGEYIRRSKLEESKHMIREDNLNFTEIAAALQYSTVHHFSRQFKEKFGITPTEYAKSVR